MYDNNRDLSLHRMTTYYKPPVNPDWIQSSANIGGKKNKRRSNKKQKRRSNKKQKRRSNKKQKRRSSKKQKRRSSKKGGNGNSQTLIPVSSSPPYVVSHNSTQGNLHTSMSTLNAEQVVAAKYDDRVGKNDNLAG